MYDWQMALVAIVAIISFLTIPYRIYQAHKDGDASKGDYFFIAFLAWISLGIMFGLLTGGFE